MVERLVRDQEVVGSNPVTPTSSHHPEACLLQRWPLLSISALGAASLTAAILLIDRPLARWLHAHTYGMPLFAGITHIAEVVAWLGSLSIVVMIPALAFGWRPGPVGRALFAAAAAMIVTIVLKDRLKYLFGHTWPETWINGNPSFIRDGVYGFFWKHGGPGWASFPSGHTALITAPVAALWHAWPKWRWLGALLVLLVAVGLLGANYHFLSDVIAGFLLGGAVGLAFARVADAERC